MQNSVFKGKLTESQIMKLEILLKKDVKEDETIYILKIKDSQIFIETKLGNNRYDYGNFL